MAISERASRYVCVCECVTVCVCVCVCVCITESLTLCMTPTHTALASSLCSIDLVTLAFSSHTLSVNQYLIVATVATCAPSLSLSLSLLPLSLLALPCSLRFPSMHTGLLCIAGLLCVVCVCVCVCSYASMFI